MLGQFNAILENTNLKSPFKIHIQAVWIHSLLKYRRLFSMVYCSRLENILIYALRFSTDEYKTSLLCPLSECNNPAVFAELMSLTEMSEPHCPGGIATMISKNVTTLSD